MTTWSLALTNVLRFSRRFVPLLLLLGIVGGLVTAGGSVTSGLSRNAETAKAESDLRAIDIKGKADGSKGLTASAVQEIAGMADVETVEPIIKTTTAEETTKSALSSVTFRHTNPPPPSPGHPQWEDTLKAGEVIVPYTVEDTDFASRIGEELPFSYSAKTGPQAGVRETLTLKIVGVYDPSYQVDGPAVAYMSLEDGLTMASALSGTTPENYEKLQGYDEIVVTATTPEAVDGLQKTLQEQGWHATNAAARLEEIPGALKLVRTLTWILLVALVITGLYSTLSLSSNLVRERSTEIGILRAFGWSKSKVYGLLAREMALVAVTAATITAVTGWILSIVVSQRLESLLEGQSNVVRSPTPAWMATVLGVVVLAILTGSMLPARKASTSDPLVSIKGLH